MHAKQQMGLVRGSQGHQAQQAPFQRQMQPQMQQYQHPQPMQQMQQPMMMPEDMIGAIKIKDGLFIGDEFAAQDLEFVVANKVSHIVNCAGKQMGNLWENMGVVYLTFFWMDQESQVLFDVQDKATKQIFDFVEKAQKRSQSVLVHSVRGQSRAASVLAVYIMRKYRWSMMKTLEFLSSRRPDLEIKASFIAQLEEYERRLQKQQIGPLSFTFDEYSFRMPNGQRHPGLKVSSELEQEEAILRNTFVNAQSGPIPPKSVTDAQNIHHPALQWVDQLKEKGKLAQVGAPVAFGPGYQRRVLNHRTVQSSQLKGCFKRIDNKKPAAVREGSRRSTGPTQEKQLNLNQDSSEGGIASSTDVLTQSAKQRESQKAPKTLNFYDQPQSSNEEPIQSNSLENDNAEEVIFQGSTRAQDNRGKIRSSGNSHRGSEQQQKKSSGRSAAQTSTQQTQGTPASQADAPKVAVTNIITNNNYNNFIINNPKIEVTTNVPIVGLQPSSAPSQQQQQQQQQQPQQQQQQQAKARSGQPAQYQQTMTQQFYVAGGPSSTSQAKGGPQDPVQVMNRRGKSGHEQLNQHGQADTTSFRMPKGHSPKVVAHHASSGSKGVSNSNTSSGNVSQKFGINGFTANGKMHQNTTQAQAGFPRQNVVTSGSKINSQKVLVSSSSGQQHHQELHQQTQFYPPNNQNMIGSQSTQNTTQQNASGGYLRMSNNAQMQMNASGGSAQNVFSAHPQSQFKQGGPVRAFNQATSQSYNLQPGAGASASQPLSFSGRPKMNSTGSKSNQIVAKQNSASGISNSTKTRASGSLQPDPRSGAGRPGTAPKRPGSPGMAPNQQPASASYSGGLNTFSFGQMSQSHQPGQAMGNSQILQGLSAYQVHSKQRGGSHKPSSAPTKNRLRSQSPLTQLTEKQAKASKGTSGGAKASQDYYKQQQQTGQQSLVYQHGGYQPGQLNHFSIPAQAQAQAQQRQGGSRGYSPSKPKWKSSQQQSAGAQGMIVASAQQNVSGNAQIRTASGAGGVGVARTTKTLGSHYKY